MPTIDEKLRNYFIGDGVVSNTVGNRVYGGKAPQQATKPYVRFMRVSKRYFKSHDQTADLGEPSFQFDCVGKTRSQAIDLMNDVINSSSSLEDETGIGSVRIQNSRDAIRDEDESGWQAQVDLAIMHDSRIQTT